jgi:hypothetical protein
MDDFSLELNSEDQDNPTLMIFGVAEEVINDTPREVVFKIFIHRP